MLGDIDHPEDLPVLFTAIDRWRGEVAKTEAHFAGDSPTYPRFTPNTVQPRYQTRLQTRIPTQPSPLIHTASTSQSKKRQAPQQLLAAPASKRQTMPGRGRGRGQGHQEQQGEQKTAQIPKGHDRGQQAGQEEQNTTQTAKRGRGRPPTQRAEQETAMMHPPPLLPTPSASSWRPTPASRPSSPRKQSVKPLTQERSSKTVDLDTLRTCDPALLPLSSVAARRQGSLSPAVRRLVQRLQSLPPGLVPSELKARSFLPAHYDNILTSFRQSMTLTRIHL